MRKHLIMIAFGITCAITSNAQYQTYAQNSPGLYNMDCAIKQIYTPGYLWFGSYPASPGGLWANVNFQVSGYSPTGANINSGYTIMQSGGSCSGLLNPATNCRGVSAIETNISSTNSRYAVAGTYDDGVFFTTMTGAGNITGAKMYPFPWIPSSTVTKPLIVEEGQSNRYYICGKLDQDMYIIKVNDLGNILWSFLYKLGSGITPEAILDNSIYQNELIVVGSVLNPPQGIICNGQASFPFFMKIDSNTGNVLINHIYSAGGCSWNASFNSIIHSNVNPAANEFIIGGGVDPSLGGGGACIIKVNQNGFLLAGHGLVNSTSAVAVLTGPVIGLIERKNTSNIYEYFTLAPSPLGMAVFKLDNNFNPFPISSPNALNNEFTYNAGWSSVVAQPIAITDNSVAGIPGHDVGIQIFGNDDYGQNCALFISAYYNGETNCSQTLSQMSGTFPYNANPIISTPNTVPGLVSCSNFMITQATIWPGNNIPCQGNMPGGSNQRTSNTNSLGEDNFSEEDFRIFPNPVYNKSTIDFYVGAGSNVKTELFNSLGQKVCEIKNSEKVNGRISAEIDFKELGLKKGIYFVSFTIDGESYKKKIVYTE